MKILLVQTSFLGDTILSTPVIAGIKSLHPNSELWLMTTPLSKELVCRDPEVSGVISFDKRGTDRGVKGLLKMAKRLQNHQFDVVYSLHKSFRTAFLLSLARIPKRIGFAQAKGALFYHQRVKRLVGEHDVLRNLSLLELETESSKLNLELRIFKARQNELTEIIDQLPQEGYVAMVPGSAWKTKRWHAQGFRETAEHFLSLGLGVVVLGAPNETEVANKVADGLTVTNLCGKTSIPELMHAISNAQLVVCNDSMSLHLASAFKVPTVSVFCATSPSFGFGPWKNKAKIVEKQGLDCKPCRRHGSNHCPTGTELCMTGVPSEAVIEAAQDLIQI